MSASNNNSHDLPDKNYLYGNYREGEVWRQTLGRKATYKALDIPDDDVNINARTDNSRSGIGALGAVGIAAVSGGLPLLGWLLGAFDRPDSPAPLPDPPPAVVKPADPPPADPPEKPEPVPPVIITEPGKIIERDWRVGDPIVE